MSPARSTAPATGAGTAVPRLYRQPPAAPHAGKPARHEANAVRAQALAASFIAPRAGAEQRAAAGKALREQVPLATHAAFGRYPGIDPLQILRAQARTRLPELVPVRHARMLQSPFAFLRGSAAVMAADLARTPATRLNVQACGDMHVANFGLYATAERQLVFAINDFDETYPGRWEWDVKRLAASALVASEHLLGNGRQREAAVRAVVSSYRKNMRRYAAMGHLEVWYEHIDSERLLAALSPAVRLRARRVMASARRRTHLQVLDKMTDLVDNRHRIVEQAPFIVRESFTQAGRPVREALGHFLLDYLESLRPGRRLLLSRYRLIDVARKVVGVGSVGTRCWVLLLQGEADGDPLFLQVKEAQPSVLARHCSIAGAGTPASEGERVVNGQQLIQGSPDIFLGWGELDGVHYYVRQLRDMKGGIDIEPGAIKPSSFVEYCALCGWALALAHAKSGDAAAIGGYLGKSEAFDDALLQFAQAYARQTERDYDAMWRAARAGRIEVAEAMP